ncbi:MAG TPA: hypothetical protein VGB76_10440, partial [Pyrinomonadaceae bacterium]
NVRQTAAQMNAPAVRFDPFFRWLGVKFVCRFGSRDTKPCMRCVGYLIGLSSFPCVRFAAAD